MTCANWMLTVLGAVIFIFAMWPSILGLGAAKWIISIAAILIVVIAWTGCRCGWCEMAGTKKKKK